jgi:acyl carrier protein
MKIRERILNCFEPIVGIKPHEDDCFYDLCDMLDYVEVVMNVEKEFNCNFSEADNKDEFDFDTVKEFIDYMITCLKNQITNLDETL